jgi:hypothetical protein
VFPSWSLGTRSKRSAPFKVRHRSLR